MRQAVDGADERKDGNLAIGRNARAEAMLLLVNRQAESFLDVHEPTMFHTGALADVDAGDSRLTTVQSALIASSNTRGASSAIFVPLFAFNRKNAAARPRPASEQRKSFDALPLEESVDPGSQALGS